MDPAQESYLELLKEVLTASIYEESAWSVVEAGRIGSPRRPLRFARDLLRKVLVSVLGPRYLLVHARPYSAAARSEGRDWPLFGYTMAGHRRLDNVRTCLESVLADRIPGDFIETGAWRGGTSIYARALLRAHGVADRRVWVADSFEGLPVPKSPTDGQDLSHVDHLKVSLERVQANFARFGLLDQQVEFLPGWFSDTLPTAPIQKIAILRLDGDLYSSTMDALRHLYHKVETGGYVIVDDYYSWEPCRRAVTEFLAEKSLRPEIIPIDWTGAYWRV